MLENLNAVLNTRLLSLAGFELSLAQLISVPLLVIVGFLLVSWLVRWTETALRRRGVNPDIVQITRRGVMITGLIILVITTLDYLRIPLTAFAFVSGAVAIGVGFGAQNIINNFISGWILMWERPIRINDFIEVGDTMGTVEQINNRSTQIRRVDGVHLLVPNSHLLEQTVVNWTLVDKQLRCILRVGVVYGSDVELARTLLLQVVAGHDLVLKDPAPLVIFEDFGDNALIFDTFFWVESVGETSARQIRSDIRFEIDRLFGQHDLIIAFPQRDVHLDGVLRLKRE